MRSRRFLALFLLLSLAGGAARAQQGWRLEPLLRLGDRVGELTLPATGYFRVGMLNDAGQLLTVAKGPGAADLLLQLGAGTATPLVAPGWAAPGGTWSAAVSPRSPVSLNQEGNAVFAAEVDVEGASLLGTFRWDRAAGKILPVALPGMPAGPDHVLERGGGATPVLNNRNEIALVAGVRSAAGTLADGIFLARDDTLAPVALPDGALPDGTLERAAAPSINDAGAVAFLATKRGDRSGSPSAYLWDGATTRLLLAPGMTAPERAPFYHVESVRLNLPLPGALLLAHASNDHSRHDPRLTVPPLSLYRWVDGTLTPLVRIGQNMPGGGRLWTIEPGGVSPMNAAGEVAILARLLNEQIGLYLCRANGALVLLLKPGSTTPFGRVAAVGSAGGSSGVALNDRGQIAVTLKIGRDPETLYLLTPTGR
jgi:hypothetical protein